MTDWILINGVKVDLADFEVSYDKANNHVWEKAMTAGEAISGRLLDLCRRHPARGRKIHPSVGRWNAVQPVL